MRNLLITITITAILFAACKKKDSFNYVCSCKIAATGLNDTNFIINAATSGQAAYLCHNYADSANKKGKGYACDIN